MSDYQAVQKALAAGADPGMLCTTCPWDRTCISPPSMTKAEIDAEIAKASADDDKRAAAARLAGEPAPMPTGSLMTALVYGAKDTQSQVCPVFALRLRSSGGRKIADSLRVAMQGWDDQQ